MSSEPRKSTAVAKSIRHRKKNYYNLIRKQMEFYFGDANLSKDRFLMSMIKADQYVPLTTFMTFNKMKALAKDVEDIAKSLTNSELLELNESGTAVRRRTAIPADRNADDRTIYVEAIPQNANHETVIKAFSRFGPVAYVSLPKYRNSKRLKEFGFVEFDDVACITKALKAFQAFNGVLAFDSAKPEELTSIRAFICEQKEEQTVAEVAAVGGRETEYTATSDISSDSSSEMSSQPPRKRSKMHSDIETPTSELETTNDHRIKKKRRHRKRLKKTATTTNRDETESGPFIIKKTPDAGTSSSALDVTQLRITSKREWKRLRNRYLNLQRDKMSELKRRNHQKIAAIGHRTTASTAKFARTITTQKLLIHRSPHNMNFYQDRGDPENQNTAIESNSKASGEANSATRDQENASTTATAAKQKAIERDPLIHYESGLIVNIRFVEPCVNVKEFKLKMRQYDPVKYVDVKEGSIEAYLRCSNAPAAKKLCRKITEQYSCEILSGLREQTYWQKIMRDRSEKLNKAVKIKSRRGREKLKQMNIHLRFDGADE